MVKQKLFMAIVLIQLCFISIGAASDTGCLERVGKFTLSKNKVEAQLKNLIASFNNFEKEVKTIQQTVKQHAAKLGGVAQSEYYDLFKKLKKQLENQLNVLENSLGEYVYLTLAVEDCNFNKLLDDEEYKNLLDL